MANRVFEQKEDMRQERTREIPYSVEASLVRECLNGADLIGNLEDSVRYILGFMGQRFQCDRCYVFQTTEKGSFQSTAEWCAPGIMPWEESEEPQQILEGYQAAIDAGEQLFLRNVEGLRQQFPSLYACLKTRGVKGLTVQSLVVDGKVWGLFGADNSRIDQPQLLSDFMAAISHYIVSAVQQREMQRELHWLRHYDRLTGVYNRQEFERICQEGQGEHTTLGVVRVCVLGLAEINARSGQSYGDHVLRQSSRLLKNAFPMDNIYRIGGGEFVILCWDKQRRQFEGSVHTLRMLCEGFRECGIEVGNVWSDSQRLLIRSQLAALTRRMDEEHHSQQEQTIVNEPMYSWNGKNFRISGNEFGAGFAEYIHDNHFDLETVIKSLARTDLPIFLFFGDLRTNMFYVSDTMRDTFGFASNMVPDLLNVWGKRIGDSNDYQRYFRNLKQILHQRQDRHELRYRVRDRFGRTVWVHSSALIQWDEQHSRPMFCAGLISRQDSKLVVDPVTNYPLEQAALAQLSMQCLTNKRIPVIGFSLNSFSEINRTLGRNKADRLIRDFANHLVISYGEYVNFFRLDGLRFIAILSGDCPMEQEEVARQIRECAKTIYRRYGVSIKTPCSVGMLYYPDAGENATEFVEEAIALISLAKNSGEKEFVVHTSRSAREQRERAQLALELNKCVLNDFNGFRIVIQPIVNAKTQRIEGGETLARWNCGGKDISPGIFIPMLEDSKLIFLMGKWIFEQSVRACRRLVMYDSEFHLSFNVSYLQVLDDTFLPFIKATLKRYGVRGENLIMELTETHYDEAPEKLADFVKGCRELGISIALDDFGNGYSSLALLLKCPTDIIKLDRELVSKVTESSENLQVIRMIVTACHQLGRRICAEGVETEQEKEIVRDTGCDMIQGYYYYRPQEVDDLFQILAREND